MCSTGLNTCRSTSFFVTKPYFMVAAAFLFLVLEHFRECQKQDS